MDPNNQSSEPINPFPEPQPATPVEEKPPGDKMNKLSGFAGEMISKHYEDVLRAIVGAGLSVLKLIRYFIQQFINQVFSK